LVAAAVGAVGRFFQESDWHGLNLTLSPQTFTTGLTP